MSRFLRRMPGAALLLLAAGCASVPDPIRDAPDGVAPSLARDDPQAVVGQRVRWGGTIAAVENTPENTRVVVVARRLTSAGRPRDEDRSNARFIAVLEGFHDPVVLQSGREFTVVGTVQRTEPGKVGDFDYLYPVLAVEHYRLWPARVELPYPPPPFYYDPWYPYPYYWPHPHRRR